MHINNYNEKHVGCGVWTMTVTMDYDSLTEVTYVLGAVFFKKKFGKNSTTYKNELKNRFC